MLSRVLSMTRKQKGMFYSGEKHIRLPTGIFPKLTKLNNKFDIELPVSGVLENSICSQRLHIVYTKSFSLASAVFLRSKFHIASIYPLKSMFSSPHAIHIFSLANAMWQGAGPQYRLLSSFPGLHPPHACSTNSPFWEDD